MSRNPLEGVAEPAGMLGRQKTRAKRSEAARRWDRENRPTSYRLDPRVPETVREIVTWYEGRGYSVTQGQVVEDLLLFAFDAWEEGKVEINVRENVPTLRAVRRE